MENTTNTTETAARLRRAVTRLNRRLRYSALGGISPAQASMLASIDSLKNPSLGDLALAEQIQPPSVTRLARVMQKSGLITCSPDAEDRRSTRVSITALGRKEIENIRRRKTEFLERKLVALSTMDQQKADELVDFLELLLADE